MCTIFSAFIVYAKEENDPYEVQCLTDLLTNCGIVCDVDLYHVNENIDWLDWVEKSLSYHVGYLHCYVILVCSPTMRSVLDERNPHDYILMTATYITGQVLRQCLQQYPQSFLPIIINDVSTDYVPPILSRQTCYHFPYNKLYEMPEDVTPRGVIHHPDFTSVRRLVTELTGLQEFPPANVDQGDLRLHVTWLSKLYAHMVATYVGIVYSYLAISSIITSSIM